jgi:hypothetical protein
MKRILFVASVLAFLLSACGAKATPTVDPAQIQASAVAAASTMVALTQAAIPPTQAPTDTPEPSPTPLPSPTPAPLPTLPGFPTAVNPTVAVVPTIASPSSSSSGSTNTGDSCNAPLGPNPAGTKVKAIVIVNSSGAQANGSIYLSKTKFGECGYRGYSLAKGSSITYTDLTTGCYYLYAWINDPKHPTTVSGSACINGPDKTTFTITTTSIKVQGP